MEKKPTLPWLILLFTAVLANHYCRKNAWLYWDVIDSQTDSYSVKVNLSNGQGYTEIASSTVMKAFSSYLGQFAV
ncbi:hypothetical protein CP532_4669 [Ophiocordyceps camponoti-leonardi (nom. inval.)]|nr:hypothetical protein CP532_4669 [Ophiocordyceps camponoti-leonardi (nom. inval.)]